MYPDEFPPMEQLQAMSPPQYNEFFTNNVMNTLRIPTPQERCKGIEVGDEVIVIFDSLQASLGLEGVVEMLKDDDNVYPFSIKAKSMPAQWFTWAVLKEPKIEVPEFSSIEDADRFLEQIKER